LTQGRLFSIGSRPHVQSVWARIALARIENGTAAGLDARCAFRYVPPPFVLP
jgi:hypothetical protein